MHTLAEPGDEHRIFHLRMVDLLGALQQTVHDVSKVFVFESPCWEVCQKQLPERSVHQQILNVRCHLQNVAAIARAAEQNLAVHAEPPQNSGPLLGCVDPYLE